MTRMVSNDQSIPATTTDHRCRCNNDHISLTGDDALRKEKNEEELEGYRNAPYQQALSDWATAIIQMIKLKPGGPRLSQKGEISYDMAPRAKDGGMVQPKVKEKGMLRNLESGRGRRRWRLARI